MHFATSARIFASDQVKPLREIANSLDDGST